MFTEHDWPSKSWRWFRKHELSPMIYGKCIFILSIAITERMDWLERHLGGLPKMYCSLTGRGGLDELYTSLIILSFLRCGHNIMFCRTYTLQRECKEKGKTQRWGETERVREIERERERKSRAERERERKGEDERGIFGLCIFPHLSFLHSQCQHRYHIGAVFKPCGCVQLRPMQDICRPTSVCATLWDCVPLLCIWRPHEAPWGLMLGRERAVLGPVVGVFSWGDSLTATLHMRLFQVRYLPHHETDSTTVAARRSAE